MVNSNCKDKTKAMVQIVFGATVLFVCVYLWDQQVFVKTVIMDVE